MVSDGQDDMVQEVSPSTTAEYTFLNTRTARRDWGHCRSECNIVGSRRACVLPRVRRLPSGRTRIPAPGLKLRQPRLSVP